MNKFSFIQLADPQFGLFAASSGKTDEEIASYAKRGLIVRKVEKFDGLEPEINLYNKAIERANQLKPRFVVVCGDIINDIDNEDQINEVKRISKKLEDSIDLHWVPGNHDVSPDHNTPEKKCIERYRKNFGPDYYTFSHGDIKFIVINSTVLTSPETVIEEADKQMEFIEKEAMTANKCGKQKIILFSHHPLFINSPNESDNNWSIKKQYRSKLLKIASDHGITANFAGHWHKNNYAYGDGIEVVASGPVGYPFGEDPSGFRIVDIKGTEIQHAYHSLEL